MESFCHFCVIFAEKYGKVSLVMLAGVLSSTCLGNPCGPRGTSQRLVFDSNPPIDIDDKMLLIQVCPSSISAKLTYDVIYYIWICIYHIQ